MIFPHFGLSLCFLKFPSLQKWWKKNFSQDVLESLQYATILRQILISFRFLFSHNRNWITHLNLKNNWKATLSHWMLLCSGKCNQLINFFERLIRLLRQLNSKIKTLLRNLTFAEWSSLPHSFLIQNFHLQLLIP